MDLAGVDLSGADLSGADLSGADLSGSSLSDADLSGAHLERSNLSSADLTGATFQGADLTDADLYGTIVEEVQLDQADCVPLSRGYHRLHKLMSGGMADVFVGVKLGVIEKRYAIKRIRQQLAEVDRFQDMFQDEARLYGSLEHPNIIRALDFFELRGNFYIAMEYVDGVNLTEIWKYGREHGQLPVETLAFLGAQICAGLHHAHSLADPHTGAPLGIIHRDISLSNVLVSRHGEVKLIDFGVAKARSNVGKTVAGFRKGKSSYMSPEQIQGFDLGPHSDIFSVGVVLFEITTISKAFFASPEEISRELSSLRRQEPGRVFDSSSVKRNIVIQKVINEPPELNKVPRELRGIIKRAMEKMRQRRFSSAQEMEETLLVHSNKHQQKALSKIVADILDRKHSGAARRSSGVYVAGGGAASSQPMTPSPAVDPEPSPVALPAAPLVQKPTVSLRSSVVLSPGDTSRFDSRPTSPLISFDPAPDLDTSDTIAQISSSEFEEVLPELTSPDSPEVSDDEETHIVFPGANMMGPGGDADETTTRGQALDEQSTLPEAPRGVLFQPGQDPAADEAPEQAVARVPSAVRTLPFNKVTLEDLSSGTDEVEASRDGRIRVYLLAAVITMMFAVVVLLVIILSGGQGPTDTERPATPGKLRAAGGGAREEPANIEADAGKTRDRTVRALADAGEARREVATKPASREPDAGPGVSAPAGQDAAVSADMRAAGDLTPPPAKEPAKAAPPRSKPPAEKVQPGTSIPETPAAKTKKRPRKKVIKSKISVDPGF